MFGVIKQSDNRYTIVEVYPYKQKTFNFRNKFKELGATWNPNTRHWENLDPAKLSEVPTGSSKRFLVITEKTSYNDGETTYVFEHQIENNKVRVLNMGDDYEWVAIKENLGEQ